MLNLSYVKVIVLKIFIIFLLLTEISAAQENTTALSLDSAIHTALQSNPVILTAKEYVQAAASGIKQAKAMPFPEFSFSLGEVPSSMHLSQYGERSIGVVLPIEFPGKRSMRGRIATDEWNIVTLQLQQAQRLVSAHVKRLYYRAVLQQKILAQQESIVTLLNQLQEIVVMRYQVQDSHLLDILKIKVELAKVENEIFETQRDMDMCRTELNQTLGCSGSTDAQLTDDLTYRPLDKTLDSILYEAQSSRSSIKMAQMLLQRQSKLIQMANRNYLPDFAIGVFNQKLKEQPPFNANDYFGSTESGLWQIDFSVSLPLWFWQKPKAEKQIAISQYHSASIQLNAVEQNTIAAITKAYHSMKTAERQVQKFQQTILQNMEDQLETGMSLYQNQKIDILDVLDIYRTWLQINTEYWTALYHYNISLADLEVAGEEDTMSWTID